MELLFSFSKENEEMKKQAVMTSQILFVLQLIGAIALILLAIIALIGGAYLYAFLDRFVGLGALGSIGSALIFIIVIIMIIITVLIAVWLKRVPTKIHSGVVPSFVLPAIIFVFGVLGLLSSVSQGFSVIAFLIRLIFLFITFQLTRSLYFLQEQKAGKSESFKDELSGVIDETKDMGSYVKDKISKDE